MKDYLKNWNIIRLIRLALGIFIIVQGIQTGEWMFILLGSLFTLMPLFNTGCCTTANCRIPAYKNKTDEVHGITDKHKVT